MPTTFRVSAFQYASLRDLAVEYGVSHETIRAIVRRVAAHRREDRIA